VTFKKGGASVKLIMLALISHPDCRDHDPGEHHPESAERLRAIDDQVIMSGLEATIRHHDAPLATRAQLERVHDPRYLDQLEALLPEEGRVSLDGDTFLSPRSLRAAARAAGAGILGVDLLMEGKTTEAFCAVRPPGHHAGRARAMGFCLYNNIAVAALHALEAYGLERVVIADFDVHHGNGTEEIVKDDSRVLFCSCFQDPFYPFSGVDRDEPHVVDVAFPSATEGPTFRKALGERWLPAIDAFRPQFVFVSAGFDAHLLDDMANMKLGESDFGWITGELAALARKHSDGRILSMLEGGYETGALARSVVAHLRALML
jgi:acetoin utilization deacetylase AcuC-like enzyme